MKTLVLSTLSFRRSDRTIISAAAVDSSHLVAGSRRESRKDLQLRRSSSVKRAMMSYLTLFSRTLPELHGDPLSTQS